MSGGFDQQRSNLSAARAARAAIRAMETPPLKCGTLDDRSVESYPIEHFRDRMVYAIRHEATTLDPVGGGAESTGGPPAVS